MELNLVATTIVAFLAFYMRFCFIRVNDEEKARHILKAHIDYWLNNILTAEKSSMYADEILSSRREKQSITDFCKMIHSLSKDKKNEAVSEMNKKIRTTEEPEKIKEIYKSQNFPPRFEEHSLALKNSIIEDKLWIQKKDLDSLKPSEINIATSVKHHLVELMYLQEATKEWIEKINSHDDVIDHHFKLVFESAKTLAFMRLLDEELKKNINKGFFIKFMQKLTRPI